MLKIVASLLALFFAGGVYLQAESWIDNFRFSAWGRGVITPLAFSGDYSSVSAATSTPSGFPDVGFTIYGTAPGQRIGFVIEAQWNGASPAAGENAKVWVQPFDFLRLTAGAFTEDELRGTVAPSEFASWLLPNGGANEDGIFSRFKSTLGAHFSIRPLLWLDSPWNGLLIAGAFGSNVSPTGTNPGEGRAPRRVEGLDAADVFRGMQIAIGYTIPDIGLFRVQFIGNNRAWLVPNYTNNAIPDGQLVWSGLSMSRDADVVEAAFRFTGVPGLNVDVGVKIPFEYTTDVGFVEYPAMNPHPPVVSSNGEERIVQRPYAVSLGVNWTPAFFSDLNLTARLDLTFGGWVKEEDVRLINFGASTAIWLLASYRVSDTVRVGLDFGVEMKSVDEWQQPIGRPFPPERQGLNGFTDVGIGPWVEMELGGGRIRTGPMIIIPGSPRYFWMGGNSPGHEFMPAFSGDPVISFPISFTYSF